MKLTLFTILLISPVVFVSSELAPQSFRDEVVQRHNELRKTHQVGPVEEDTAMSETAQQWADQLASMGRLEHNSNGQNLAEMPETSTGREYVNYLYEEEEKLYRARGLYNTEPNKENRKGVGHFTQIVWKDSKKIGIGKSGRFVVINYKPFGNYAGEYKENVLEPVSSTNDVAELRKYLFLLKPYNF